MVRNLRDSAARKLKRPRFSFRAAVTLTLRTMNDKDDQKTRQLRRLDIGSFSYDTFCYKNYGIFLINFENHMDVKSLKHINIDFSLLRFLRQENYSCMCKIKERVNSLIFY